MSEDRPADEQELRYALHALNAMERFVERDLRDLAEAIQANKPAPLLRLKAHNALSLLDRMFYARKQPVDKWLGPDNLPGSPGQQAMLRLGKAVVKKATGLDLDAEVTDGHKEDKT